MVVLHSGHLYVKCSCHWVFICHESPQSLQLYSGKKCCLQCCCMVVYFPRLSQSKHMQILSSSGERVHVWFFHFLFFMWSDIWGRGSFLVLLLFEQPVWQLEVISDEGMMFIVLCIFGVLLGTAFCLIRVCCFLHSHRHSMGGIGTVGYTIVSSSLIEWAAACLMFELERVIIR